VNDRRIRVPFLDGTKIFLFAIASGSAVVSMRPPSPKYKAVGACSYHSPPSSAEGDEWLELYLHVIPNEVLD
jgi:hypothetical protein